MKTRPVWRDPSSMLSGDPPIVHLDRGQPLLEQHLDARLLEHLVEEALGGGGLELPAFLLTVVLAEPPVELTAEPADGGLVADVGLTQPPAVIPPTCRTT